MDIIVTNNNTFNADNLSNCKIVLTYDEFIQKATDGVNGIDIDDSIYFDVDGLNPDLYEEIKQHIDKDVLQFFKVSNEFPYINEKISMVNNAERNTEANKNKIIMHPIDEIQF